MGRNLAWSATHQFLSSIPNRAQRTIIPICSPHAATAKEIHPTVDARAAAENDPPALHAWLLARHGVEVTPDGDRRASQQAGVPFQLAAHLAVALGWQWRSTTVTLRHRFTSAHQQGRLYVAPTCVLGSYHFTTFIFVHCICFLFSGGNSTLQGNGNNYFVYCTVYVFVTTHI
jgi:hypothetical protein